MQLIPAYRKKFPKTGIRFFYILYLLSLAGMLGIVTTGDAFNVFVFLEISSLAAYALIALGKDRRALWASYQYLIMGTIGATFILIGVGLMYQMTGTLNMDDLSRRLPEVAQTDTITVAGVDLTVTGRCSGHAGRGSQGGAGRRRALDDVVGGSVIL